MQTFRKVRVREWSIPAAFVLIFSLSLTNCALHGSARHKAVEASGTIHALLAALDDGEQAAYTAHAPGLTDAVHRAFSGTLAQAMTAAKDLNSVIAAWPKGSPAPPQLRALVDALESLTTDVLATLPDSTWKAAIASKLALAQQAVLTILLALV